MSTVLITGAGVGIGFHLAHCMAKLGWNVISTVHTFDHMESPLPGVVVEMDVADAGSVQRVAEQVPELDVLINNAIFQDPARDRDVLSVPLELLTKAFDVNVVGALRVAQAFIPALFRSKAGRIVNVSSFWGQISGMAIREPVAPPSYSISKAALNMVTGLLASALRDSNILVNSVCPHGGRSMDDAVKEIVWAASVHETGNFFCCRKSIPF